MSRRHVNVPLKQGVTGEGFAIKSGVKSLRKQFDTWRAKFEAENAALRAQRDALLDVAERYVSGQDLCIIGGASDPATCECVACDLTRAANVAIAKTRGAR